MRLIQKTSDAYDVKVGRLMAILAPLGGICLIVLGIVIFINGAGKEAVGAVFALIFGLLLLYNIFDGLSFDARGVTSKSLFKSQTYRWNEIQEVVITYQFGYKINSESINLVLKDPSLKQEIFAKSREGNPHQFAEDFSPNPSQMHEEVFIDNRTKRSQIKEIVELMNEFRDKYSK